MIRAAERDMREYGKDEKLYLVGKKAISYFKFRGYDIADTWQGISDQPRDRGRTQGRQAKPSEDVPRRARWTRSGSPTRSTSRR